ncbi:MAG: DUF5050 domain-containing protein [Oscillospiraceae bacterium]|nr:DUF5050 domain-containing protein [Oscillospiraceae bacterium]
MANNNTNKASEGKRFTLPPALQYLLKHINVWLPVGIVVALFLILALPFSLKWYFPSKDYAVGGLNTVGNISGNTSNIGIVAQQGEWLYFRNDKDNNCLYKIRRDGTGIQKLANDKNVSCINVLDEWVYYRCQSIYRVRTDGMGRQELTTDNSAYINVTDDGWIYYTNFNNWSISKMQHDGSSNQVVVRDKLCEGFNVSNGWIYAVDGSNLYTEGGKGDRHLYKLKTDGTEVTLLSDDIVGLINVVGDWVYYSAENDGNRLYKIKTDGSGKEKILDSSAHIFIILGETVYYIDLENGSHIYAYNMLSKESKQITQDECAIFNAVPGWVFYNRIVDGVREDSIIKAAV